MWPWDIYVVRESGEGSCGVVAVVASGRDRGVGWGGVGVLGRRRRQRYHGGGWTVCWLGVFLPGWAWSVPERDVARAGGW